MSDSSHTSLFLIRHGATDANLRRPYVLQGRGMDLSLSAAGRGQAACAARLLQPEPIVAVYSSPMRRASETAEFIAAPRDLRVETLDALTECDVGRWEGLDWDTIRAQFPREYEEFQLDCARHPYLGGESYGDVFARAVPVIEELLDRHAGQAFAVVAHNVVNRTLVAHAIGLELALAKDIQQANGSVNVLARIEGRTRLVSANSMFHLEEDLR
jgi:broad specificity phosphatase PhoE